MENKNVKYLYLVSIRYSINQELYAVEKCYIFLHGHLLCIFPRIIDTVQVITI